jgi:hypothetical protein
LTGLLAAAVTLAAAFPAVAEVVTTQDGYQLSIPDPVATTEALVGGEFRVGRHHVFRSH